MPEIFHYTLTKERVAISNRYYKEWMAAYRIAYQKALEESPNKVHDRACRSLEELRKALHLRMMAEMGLDPVTCKELTPVETAPQEPQTSEERSRE